MLKELPFRFKKLWHYFRWRKPFVLVVLIIFAQLGVKYIVARNPVSAEQLVETSWCVKPLPFVKWSFAKDGSFKQAVTIIGEFDGYRYEETGRWYIGSINNKETIIRLLYDDVPDQYAERLFVVRKSNRGILYASGEFSRGGGENDFSFFPCDY